MRLTQGGEVRRRPVPGEVEMLRAAATGDAGVPADGRHAHTQRPAGRETELPDAQSRREEGLRQPRLRGRPLGRQLRAGQARDRQVDDAAGVREHAGDQNRRHRPVVRPGTRGPHHHQPGAELLPRHEVRLCHEPAQPVHVRRRRPRPAPGQVHAGRPVRAVRKPGAVHAHGQPRLDVSRPPAVSAGGLQLPQPRLREPRQVSGHRHFSDRQLLAAPGRHHRARRRLGRELHREAPAVPQLRQVLAAEHGVPAERHAAAPVRGPGPVRADPRVLLGRGRALFLLRQGPVLGLLGPRPPRLRHSLPRPRPRAHQNRSPQGRDWPLRVRQLRTLVLGTRGVGSSTPRPTSVEEIRHGNVPHWGIPHRSSVRFGREGSIRR
ncbi:hypothetical protein MPTK1_5g13210 [Marchantia polymorpha subsp. ruderalis]|uniref:Uncharacterized protein n=2 Tax=Marchantia polymorpha TaxID=3197 RepID=A0AAF6BHV7_MARPO|nr:hypothetical protein MARPO_0032s0015 [Marchantia polymorpha]BBN11591.1 hypothetical protein Mp_5g13210 [Marchantia polymorpha subsp. ruderalis]|eukprot:PTQ41806.1 hypothetical protein MARPO_0032s0015 [Marchantia polymorpha]